MVRYQTVDDLFHAAGTTRQFAKTIGACGDQNSDHVIELQLIKEALNNVSGEYKKEDLNKLLKFFNTGVNHQCLSRDENNRKAAAIGRYIRREQQQWGDQTYIDQVKAKWMQLRQVAEVSAYSQFVTEMDKILSKWFFGRIWLTA